MSYSSLPNRSPPRDDGNHHVVALTSTTLGNLLLDHSTKCTHSRQDPVLARIVEQPVRRNVPQKNNEDFAVGVIEAKTWSKMIDEKITKIVPRTPIVTPPGEPEAINAWELMEGLDDSSPPQKMEPPTGSIGCFSLSNNPNSIPLNQPTSLSDSNSNDTSTSSSFDPNNSLHNGENEILSRNKEKLILYFTSLRGVRKTYEDCCHVRAILKNSGARVDERDVSMHSGFKEELKELLGDGYNGGGLPKVFAGKKYIDDGGQRWRSTDQRSLWMKG
ncbi:hypothetical protein L1987_05488 [Smallanthus sonchifolius]|uniref:Uncharacterized protein n=1 Tax=Smallanthus sonchifolius TaxID=185202 RepID=A0ACB9JVI5_9ASTR|nr:hypothetical protein L1987_05488 [Smallanthus sonchifolius]